MLLAPGRVSSLEEEFPLGTVATKQGSHPRMRLKRRCRGLPPPGSLLLTFPDLKGHPEGKGAQVTEP